MKKKPKILTYSEFEYISGIEFKNYYKIDMDDWKQVIPNVNTNNAKENYEEYKIWYFKKYSKLGRALL